MAFQLGIWEMASTCYVNKCNWPLCPSQAKPVFIPEDDDEDDEEPPVPEKKQKKSPVKKGGHSTFADKMKKK